MFRSSVAAFYSLLKCLFYSFIIWTKPLWLAADAEKAMGFAWEIRRSFASDCSVQEEGVSVIRWLLMAE